jgi:hypothetical protein
MMTQTLNEPSLFDFASYLLSLDVDKLYDVEGRKALTREDPLAFALLYLPHHLMKQGSDDWKTISLSEYHVEWAEYGKSWMNPAERRKSRTCFVAPREMGKSTWLFTILPLWAAAHGHVKVIAAFSEPATRAQEHLETFRNELYTNPLLRYDFPELVEPKRRPISKKNPRADKLVGQRVAESQRKIQQENDFTFHGMGFTGGALGLKSGRTRPDVIILDDVEPSEDKYSGPEILKREIILTDKILPLREDAHVVLVGTVTKPGSLIHQLIIHHEQPSNTDRSWMTDQNFKTVYMPPIILNDDGTRRSCWPEKWSLEFLESIEKTRDYKKNYLNKPITTNGTFWNDDDIVIEDMFLSARKIISIDPAVTSGSSSDFTGIAVISCNPMIKKCCVEDAWQVKLRPNQIRDFVLDLLEEDEDIAGVVIEVNQGGDTWSDIMHDLPVKVLTITNSVAKVLRLTRLLTHYQRSRVVHRRELPDLETQMFAYTGNPMARDDLLDAVEIGVDYFLSRLMAKKVDRRASVRRLRYA